MPRARAKALHRAVGAPIAAIALVAGALAGCGREGPEDPTVAAPGAGIPMGAIGATGVSFDVPSAKPSIGSAPKTKGKKPGTAPPEPMPPDPFEPPDDEPGPTPAPLPKTKKGGPKPHSPSETTL